LVRSLRLLDIRSANTAAVVAQLLGLGAVAGTDASPTVSTALRHADLPAAAAPRQVPPRPPAQAAPGTPAAAATPAHDGPSPPHRLVLRRQETLAARPAWLQDTALAAMAPPLAADPAMRLPPLFDPRRLRALLVALCSSRLPGDEVDTEALSHDVVQGRPIHAVPRLHRPSLRHGVLLLQDHRDGMAPYLQDLADLAAHARGLLPDERVQVRLLTPSLLRRRPDDGSPSVLDSLPRAVPVLVLTDLSIGGPLLDSDRASPGEWLALLAAAQRRHLRLRVLIPMARARWPLALQRHPALLEWDRGTSVGMARRAAAASSAT
jgi:hypothetical protein